MIVIDNSSKEIKAVIDPGTGITLSIENRPTVDAYKRFKAPAFMGIYSKGKQAEEQKEGEPCVKEHS